MNTFLQALSLQIRAQHPELLPISLEPLLSRTFLSTVLTFRLRHHGYVDTCRPQLSLSTRRRARSGALSSLMKSTRVPVIASMASMHGGVNQTVP